MGALAAAPGVISSPGKYYCGVTEVMEYLGCKENKADAGVSAGKSTAEVFFGAVHD